MKVTRSGGSARTIAGGAGKDRRCRRHQPLVIEERTSKGALIEAVGDHVSRGATAVEIAVDRQLFRIVVPHRQAGGVATGDVSVLSATVDLVLLVVEPMHDILRASAWETRTLGE